MDGNDSQRRPPFGVQIRSLRYVNCNETAETGTGFNYMQGGIGFFQAFFLCADFSVSTALYAGSTRRNLDRIILPHVPNWSGRLITWYGKIASKTTDDGFVVGDDVDNVSEAKTNHIYLQILSDMRATQLHKALIERRKYLDLSWLYTQLFRSKVHSVSSSIARDGRTGYPVHMEALALKIRERNKTDKPGIKSL